MEQNSYRKRLVLFVPVKIGENYNLLALVRSVYTKQQYILHGSWMQSFLKPLWKNIPAKWFCKCEKNIFFYTLKIKLTIIWDEFQFVGKKKNDTHSSFKAL